MASVKKFRTVEEVFQQIRHVERDIKHPANADINPDLKEYNYSLLRNRNMSAYEYFKKRKEELYYRKSADMVNAFGWVVTAPADLPPGDYDKFFEQTFSFLNQQYGEKNCVQAVVHYDESGQPHAHFIYIPVVEDLKHTEGEKIACASVLTRSHLRDFHTKYQNYLNENGLSHANVHTGITKKNGGNKTVFELKKEREYQLNHEHNFHF